MKLFSAPSKTKDEKIDVDNQRLQRLQQQATNNPLMSLNLNLDSLAQVGAASRAQELLQRIHALYQEGYYEVSPDVVSYNSVLKAWKEDDQPEKALELLEAMIDSGEMEQMLDGESNSNGNTNIHVDVISFNTVIAAFANQGNHQKSLQLLRQMQTDPRYPNPDTITYNIVLYSLAQSHDRGSAAKAENLLREMIQLQQSATAAEDASPCAIHVDTTSFNTCIYAWSKEKESYRAKDEQHGNSLNYGSKAMDAISNASAERALELLTIMEEMQEAGNVNVKPDVYSYTTTIQAFARCRQPQQAQRVLQQMTRRGLQPSRLTYTALMSAFAKAGQPEKAAGLLHDMMDAYEKDDDCIELKPDTVAFSCVMDGWARAASPDRPEAAEQVLTLLDTMKARAAEGMGPNSQTYTSVLTALAKCGTDEMCEMARSLLQEMEDDHSNERLCPSRIQYNAVLNAYAKSPRAEKALKAHKLFTEMERHQRVDCRPDTISYNTLLEACANSFGNQALKDMSFLVALNAFKAIMAKADVGKNKSNDNDFDALITPTSTTFAQFTKACRKLLSTQEKKLSAVKRSLFMCRKMGMLNHLVVRQGQLTCRSQDEWKKTAEELADYVDWKRDFRKCIRQVPKDWTCNARR
jgi:pentatricopeptide repeat protein